MTFDLLGPVRIRRAGKEVPAGSPQQRALVAMLLLHDGKAVGIDDLAAALWDDKPPRGALGTLRTYVSRLRRLLQDSDAAIETLGGGYALRTAPGAVDVARFEALLHRGRELGRTGDLPGAVRVLTESLALWQGEGLDGVPGTYAANQRTRLQEERLAAGSLRLAALLDTGGAVVSELTSLVEAHPYREELRALLMRALYRDGRQADAIEVYHTGARLLGEQLGLEPGEAMRSTYQRILVSDPTLTGPPAAVPAVAAPAAAVLRSGVPQPAQLPADQRGFVGRRDELAWADGLLAAEDPPTSILVSGMGGVGKSTLAVHWAHRNVASFPDGQLYVNLRGFDHRQPPVSPEDALVWLLESLGVPGEEVPDGLDARAALYRSALAGRRILVVLDNARDAEQVRPLLPGTPASLALVTSRDRLGSLRVGGTEAMHLDVLPDGEATALLTRRAGESRVAAEPDALVTIVRATAGLPLALAVVAARLADDTSVPLATVASELRSARSTLDALGTPDPTVDVRAVLSWSCTNLDPETLRALCQLAVLPEAPFDASAARSAMGTGNMRLLDRLVHASLLTRMGASDYALHDFVRAYAGELAEQEPEVRRTAIQRALDHYTGSAVEATAVLEPLRDHLRLTDLAPGAEIIRPSDGPAAFTWFAERRGALRAAVEVARAEGMHERAWQLSWALAAYLHRGEYWTDAVDLWQVAIEAAERTGSAGARARTMQGLAVALFHQHRALPEEDRVSGDPDPWLRSSALLREAIDLYLSEDMRESAAWALITLGSYVGTDNDPVCVTGALERAQELAETPTLRALALNNLSVHLVLLGDIPRGVETARQAVALLREPNLVAHARDTLGIAELAAGDARGAIESFREAARLFKSVQDMKHRGLSLANLGDAYATAGDTASASAARSEAIELLEAANHPAADQLRNLAPGEVLEGDVYWR